ncbi:SRPBCC family protein [Sphingosinicella terrae]|uniref:SRPBCC family protein n=1 Tax=Sphingosinicella terrae TaxID=2172047 RepID=UPI000E0D7E50|nr:SRPBCC family protein [Sphingosinicella terrae]
MNGRLEIAAKGEREIVITRLFAAPPHLVFEAHTVPALLKRWLSGPEGWTLAACEIDLRVGGTYRYEWRHQDGRVMGMSGSYREIEPPKRLVATELFDEDWTGGETLNTQSFEAIGDHTRLTTNVLYASAAARDGALSSNMEAGMAVSYGKLDVLFTGAPIEPA